jgi:hypothetical protein
MARPATLSEALRDVDRAMLISSSDPTMLEVQSNFIDAAAKAGVKHVVKLCGGATLPRMVERTGSSEAMSEFPHPTGSISAASGLWLRRCCWTTGPPPQRSACGSGTGKATCWSVG